MTMVRSRFGGLSRQFEKLFNTGTAAGLSETQLLEAFVTRGDESAFEALVSRYGPMVLSVCRQILEDPNDIDDAFQATFLVLVRKASSLRRKELLGNWLYGVAYRVASRSRCLAAQRRSRLGGSEQLASFSGGNGDDSVTENVLLAEERPMVHDEVNRLPQKYRVPIVLCYFEGLTHEEAADRLGWPIGTVKGRLSRARDLLRSRLSRRGMTASAAALTGFLAGTTSRAAVPAPLAASTIKAALAMGTKAGVALTATSAISLPVANLTEGVLHAMVLSQIKTLAIPGLFALGLLTTGASVVAYQGIGSASAPAGSAGSASTPALSEIDAARQVLNNLRKAFTSGTEGAVIDPSQYYNWSLNLLEAEQLASNRDNEAAEKNLKAHHDRIASLIADLKPLEREGKISRSVVPQLETYLKRADRELARVSKAKGNAAGAGEIMRVFAGVVDKPAVPIAVAAGGGAGGGGGIASPAPARNGMGGGFVGGVGGGGGATDGMSDTAIRQQIAQVSARISTLDKSPRNQAILQTLDQPMTLHFANETPLEDVLKHIQDRLKASNGKKLAIYIDPVGLAEAEKTLTSPVNIDLEEVPLKFSLRLLLKQLGLAYAIRDGVLIISSVQGIHNELMEAQSELMGLNPENFQGMENPMGTMMRGMGGGGMR